MFLRKITQLIFSRQKDSVGIIFYIGTGKTHVINMSRSKFFFIRTIIFIMIFWCCLSSIILSKMLLLDFNKSSQIRTLKQQLLLTELSDGHLMRQVYTNDVDKAKSSFDEQIKLSSSFARTHHNSNNLDLELHGIRGSIKKISQGNHLLVEKKPKKLLLLIDEFKTVNTNNEFKILFRIINKKSNFRRKGYIAAVVQDISNELYSMPNAIHYSKDDGKITHISNGHRFSLQNFSSVTLSINKNIKPKLVKIFIFDNDYKLHSSKVYHLINSSV